MTGRFQADYIRLIGPRYCKSRVFAMNSLGNQIIFFFVSGLKGLLERGFEGSNYPLVDLRWHRHIILVGKECRSSVIIKSERLTLTLRGRSTK